MMNFAVVFHSTIAGAMLNLGPQSIGDTWPLPIDFSGPAAVEPTFYSYDRPTQRDNDAYKKQVVLVVTNTVQDLVAGIMDLLRCRFESVARIISGKLCAADLSLRDQITEQLRNSEQKIENGLKTEAKNIAASLSKAISDGSVVINKLLSDEKILLNARLSSLTIAANRLIASTANVVSTFTFTSTKTETFTSTIPISSGSPTVQSLSTTEPSQNGDDSVAPKISAPTYEIQMNRHHVNSHEYEKAIKRLN